MKLGQMNDQTFCSIKNLNPVFDYEILHSLEKKEGIKINELYNLLITIIQKQNKQDHSIIQEYLSKRNEMINYIISTISIINQLNEEYLKDFVWKIKDLREKESLVLIIKLGILVLHISLKYEIDVGNKFTQLEIIEILLNSLYLLHLGQSIDKKTLELTSELLLDSLKILKNKIKDNNENFSYKDNGKNKLRNCLLRFFQILPQYKHAFNDYLKINYEHFFDFFFEKPFNINDIQYCRKICNTIFTLFGKKIEKTLKLETKSISDEALFPSYDQKDIEATEQFSSDVNLEDLKKIKTKIFDFCFNKITEKNLRNLNEVSELLQILLLFEVQSSNEFFKFMNAIQTNLIETVRETQFILNDQFKIINIMLTFLLLKPSIGSSYYYNFRELFMIFFNRLKQNIEDDMDFLHSIFTIFRNTQIIDLELAKEVEKMLPKSYNKIPKTFFLTLLQFYSLLSDGLLKELPEREVILYIKRRFNDFSLSQILDIVICSLRFTCNSLPTLWGCVRYLDNESWSNIIQLLMSVEIGKMDYIEKLKLLRVLKIISIIWKDMINKDLIEKKIIDLLNCLEYLTDINESEMQKEVEDHLKKLHRNFKKEALLEHILAVDFLIDEKIILEINGPSHYFVVYEDSQQHSLMNPKLIRNRNTILKNYLIEKMGYRYKEISFEDWSNLESFHKKREFLSKFLRKKS